MRLIFYSDQIIDENHKVNQKCLALLGMKTPKVGYIPSGGDPDRTYFNAQKDYYRQYGIVNFVFYDLEQEYEPSSLEQLLSCDMIHLSGGDPIRFLSNMERRRFKPVLAEFAKKGGVLAGVSGGGVLMGQTAGLFKMFQSDLETALQNRDQLHSLKFVEFEFLPHYNRWDDPFKRAVLEYSAATATTILACNDGDGIVVNNDRIDCLGNVVQIKDGVESLR